MNLDLWNAAAYNAAKDVGDDAAAMAQEQAGKAAKHTEGVWQKVKEAVTGTVDSAQETAAETAKTAGEVVEGGKKQAAEGVHQFSVLMRSYTNWSDFDQNQAWRRSAITIQLAIVHEWQRIVFGTLSLQNVAESQCAAQFVKLENELKVLW